MKRRLEGSKEQPKVIMLILELLDLAMQKCGNPLHVQVGNKEFMNSLILLLNQKGLPPQVRKLDLSDVNNFRFLTEPSA
jgi:hypothetical protein